MLDIQIGGISCKVSLLFPAVLLCMLLFDQSGLAAFGFLAACTHECGHIAVLCFLHEKPTALVFSFFGMRMELSGERCRSFRAETWIAFGGPFVNLLCAAMLMIFQSETEYVLIHLMLAAVNLLPILPLDGGRICFSLLGMLFSEKAVVLVMEILFWFVWGWMICLGGCLLFRSGHNATLLIMSGYLLCVKVFYKGN